MNEPDLEKMEQKAYSEFMQDGLTEILLGILLAGATAIFGKPSLTAGFVVFYLLFVPRIYERLKRRYTYPRIGYAKLHIDPPKKTAFGIFSYMLVVAVVMVVALLIIFGDLAYDLWYRWLPTFMGAMLTGAFTYVVGKSGNPHYYGPGFFGLAVGVVFSVYGFESARAGIVVYLLFMGACFIGLGLTRFTYFLHTHPVLEEVCDD